ncbi:MAG: ferrochelatase [Myxococcales bacterium]|nr:ferrochelatase [Myxococcales bacterium]
MAEKAPTAIVLLNLGGPSNQEEVEPFLLRLFADREIIQLPWQSVLGPFIAKRRTPKVQKLYQTIGGGSPIKMWTQKQGDGMVKLLDQLSPETAPHKAYIAFRYASPLTEDALKEMQADGVQRAIAFTQYPHFSCATTGSSLNELWREIRRLGMEQTFSWSVIDRWHTHPGFIRSMVRKIEEGLDKFAPEEREEVVLLFSAHSLPLRIVERGDHYPEEIAETIHLVMQSLDYKYRYMLSYQSEVGPVKWMGPSTEKMIKSLPEKGYRHVLAVPIAFTSDHIETLVEIDQEYGELAHECGLTHFHRAPSLNDDPIFLEAMADIVSAHIHQELVASKQYSMRCPGCTNPDCRQVLNPFKPYKGIPQTPHAPRALPPSR